MCNMPEVANAAWARVEEVLPELPRQFSSYEDELEQARVLRGSTKRGHWTNDAKDSSGNRVVQPFLANEIRPHEIWIPLAEELFLRGENSICATFLNEALRHAEVYDDLRASRRLHLLRAKIAREEGDAMAVLTALGNVEHTEPLETVEMADLLIGAYSQLRSPVLVEQVLQEAQKAMKAKQKGKSGKKEATLGLDLDLAAQKIERL